MNFVSFPLEKIIIPGTYSAPFVLPNLVHTHQI